MEEKELHIKCKKMIKIDEKFLVNNVVELTSVSASEKNN